MMDKTKKIFSVIFSALALVVVVLGVVHTLGLTPVAFAQGVGTTNGDAGGFVICGNEATNPCTIKHLFAAFIIIINYLIMMAGFVAVVAIVYSGFMMVYSQGQEQLKTAKSHLSGAIIGLVFIAGAYVLVNTLFAGRFSVGVCNGESILTSPISYIQDRSCEKSGTAAPSTTNGNSTKVNANTKVNSNKAGK